MTGTPSQAAKTLVGLICRQKEPLKNCCCNVQVSSFWRDLLPTAVRAAVASYNLATDFQATLDEADNVWHAIKRPAQVSAIKKSAEQRAGSANAASNADNASASNEADGTAAAVTSSRRTNQQNQRGQGRGGRRRRGGQGPVPATSTDETPPENCCSMHKTHGKNAFYCAKPSKCPWKSFCKPPIDED